MKKPDEAHLGQFVRTQKRLWNIHTLIHALYPKTRLAFRPSAIITQQKRLPDISFYQGFIDWDKMRSMTDTVIIRAGQNEWIDSRFVFNWTEARRRGMKRGVYWFYDGRVSPGRQAELLAALLLDDQPEMEIWIDWEKNYGGAHEGLPNVVAMMERVEKLLPGAKVGMYSGYYFFTGNSNPVMHAAQYAYLKTRSLWLAWYTSDASVVKIPQPWTDLLYWQYGTPAIGAQYGVETVEIDMNYFNGTAAEFNQRYGGGVNVPTPTQPYPGVEYYEFTHNGVKVYGCLIDMRGKRAMVTNTNGALKTTSQVAQETGAQIVRNADGWDWRKPAPYSPYSLASSNGYVYQNYQYDFRPFLDVAQDNTVTLTHRKTFDLYNTFSGFRYLVENGQSNPALADRNKVENTELHARSWGGVTKDGKLMLFVSDGTYQMTAGLTLPMMADISLAFGAQSAMDNDSGGSSAMWLKDRIVNQFSDPQERAVINHLCIFIDEKPGETTMENYEVKSDTNDMSLRADHNVNAAKLETVPKATLMKADSTWTAAVDGVNVRAGDIWAHVISINNVTKNGWVAVKHLGAVYCTLKEILSPTVPGLPVSITLGDDIIYIKQTVNITLKPKV